MVAVLLVYTVSSVPEFYVNSVLQLNEVSSTTQLHPGQLFFEKRAALDGI